MVRAGRHHRKRAWAITWRRLGRVWWVLLIAVTVVTLPTALFAVFLPRAVIPGAIVSAAGVGGILVFGLNLDGSRLLRDGALGEEWTAAALRPLLRRGWKIAHNVPFERRDIDHVLIGSEGAIAVESKYTNAELRVTEGGIFEVGLDGWEKRQAIRGPITGARSGADRLRSLLRGPGRVVTRPLAVLVLWGPRVTRSEAGAVVLDGVLVCVGYDAKKWLDLFRGEPLTDEEVNRAWQAVLARKNEHKPRLRAVPPQTPADRAA